MADPDRGGELPRLLAAAPHRLMFFAGASAVIVSMLWWTAWLASGQVDGLQLPAPSVPAGWAHAVLTQYGMLPMFMFGFLLTVYPRWLSQPVLTRRHYVPVFLGLFGGYLLTHLGLVTGRGQLLIAGLAMMLAGWCYGLAMLARLLVRNGAQDRHALSTFVALTLGALGLGAFTAFALGAPWWLAIFAIKLGTFGLLLPVYFTVCHRMIPFFTAAVVPDYRVVRPTWSLPVLWVLLLAHLALELGHVYPWLWLADLPLAVFFVWHGWAWQPWKARRPGLLAVLHLAAAWLPIAFALYAVQSLVLLVDERFILGRVPIHVLTIGFFGSMLVAMVTRVTQGHSGRPLEMGPIPWLTFVLLQIVVVLRIHAEMAADSARWLVIAAVAWLLAFLPWVVRSLSIYLTPRIDGKPG